MASEQSGSKSYWKFMVEICLNGQCEDSIHQRKSTKCFSRKLESHKEYGFKLVKSTSERIKAAIKIQEEKTNDHLEKIYH